MARVLFVCLHNAGRSQMSRALFERAAGGRHEARVGGHDARRSGCTPRSSRSCASSASTSRDQRRRQLTREMAERADVVVTMGCGDECPYIPGKRYLDWDLPDPKGLPLEQVRAIRDDIATRVGELIEAWRSNTRAMSEQATANQALIERFYEAFDRHDGEAMAACYGPDARFHDPAFGELHGEEPGAMWKMLTGRADDLRVRLAEHDADETPAARTGWPTTRSPRPAARSTTTFTRAFASRTG